MKNQEVVKNYWRIKSEKHELVVINKINLIKKGQHIQRNV